MTTDDVTTWKESYLSLLGSWTALCDLVGVEGDSSPDEVLAALRDAIPTPPRTLLAELDACKPLRNATGPAQGGKTFSGWEVPHWLMLRVRAALVASEPVR